MANQTDTISLERRSVAGPAYMRGGASFTLGAHLRALAIAVVCLCTVAGTGTGQTSFTVLSPQGSYVYNHFCSTGSMTLTTVLAPGVYYLRASGITGTHTLYGGDYPASLHVSVTFGAPVPNQAIAWANGTIYAQGYANCPAPTKSMSFPIGVSSKQSVVNLGTCVPNQNSCFLLASVETAVQATSGSISGWTFDGVLRAQSGPWVPSAVYPVIGWLYASFDAWWALTLTSATSITITSTASCPTQPIGGGQSSQSTPILPVRPFGSGAVFDTYTNAWYDPPLAYGYRFTSQGPARFTKILNFPVGVDADGQFSVSVNGTALGTFLVGQTVDFSALTGAAVASFDVTGIDPLADAADPLAFPIELAFDVATGQFAMEPLYVSAAVATRNGGTNPLSYTCDVPVLGQPWSVNVDVSSTGHMAALLYGSLSPSQFTFASGQTLLLGAPLFQLVGAIPGPQATYSFNLPVIPALVSVLLPTQAVHFGGAPSFALSNARDLTFGF